MKKIYVASSWRNEHQETLVNELRLMGHDVYDFKHPNGEVGFKWSNMDENWQGWTMEQYRENLESGYAQFGMNRDFDAMKAADVCILCLPCGRSAHLEAGWMKGAGKKVIAYIHPGDRIEPELMYGILDGIALSVQDIARELNGSKYSYEAEDEPALIDIVGEDYGMEGVRVQALGEDFIISLHDAEGGKSDFTYNEAMKWLEDHGQQTLTRKQAGIICIYIDEINDKLVEAGGEAFAADWYTTNELYIPREQRSSADYHAPYSWYFDGTNGCFNYNYRSNDPFRCRPSLALPKPY